MDLGDQAGDQAEWVDGVGDPAEGEAGDDGQGDLGGCDQPDRDLSEIYAGVSTMKLLDQSL